VGPDRPAPARAQRRYLAQLADRRTGQAIPDRLRSLTPPLTSREFPVNDLVRIDRHNHRPVAGDSPLAEAVKLLARTHQGLIWTRQR
jgi:hypothetical protein